MKSSDFYGIGQSGIGKNHPIFNSETHPSSNQGSAVSVQPFIVVKVPMNEPFSARQVYAAILKSLGTSNEPVAQMDLFKALFSDRSIKVTIVDEIQYFTDLRF